MKSTLDRLYPIGIWIKGIDGVLEVAGGLFVLFISQTKLGQLATFLTQRELAEDPGDWIATHLRDAVGQLSPSTQQFASMYLIAHGVVKVFLVIGLLRDRLLVSVLDAGIVLLVWPEALHSRVALAAARELLPDSVASAQLLTRFPGSPIVAGARFDRQPGERSLEV